jgi:hypothetical protein
MIKKLSYVLRKYSARGAVKTAAQFAQKKSGWCPPARAACAAVVRHLDQQQLRMDHALFDALHGTDTGGVIALADLKLVNSATAECYWYEGASPSIIRQLFGALTIPFGEFDFVDFGSGKGRVLMLAAEQGFRRSIGVEFAGDLVEVARKNAEIFNSRRSKPAIIESLHMDAMDYVLPDKPLVIYFYCPFYGAVMDRVLANITSSHARNPRPIILLFNGQNEAVIEKFRATGFTEREIHLQRDPTRFIHYRGLIFISPNRSPK